jgi:cytochrome o ubiquinol oxidase subunit 1
MDWAQIIFGNLTFHAFKHDLIQTGASVSMVLGGLGLVVLLTYKKLWTWLWTEYLTSLDPKRVGIMYAAVSFVMLVKGFVDALMMRVQQAMSVGDSSGYLTSDHFQQVFSAHGTTMIFFVGMGAVFTVMNLLIPLQIGARDVAFPFLNSLSFYLFTAGALFVMVSLAIGDFSATGWTAYPPLSGINYSPHEGVDYWIWSVQIAGIGSMLSGINFLVTIIKMRCPGMTLIKMPIFVWSCLCTTILIIFAFPILTATLGLLSLDRTIGMHFFTSGHGGSPMFYVNLIWAWGHPEVYILILPVFGIFSEVVAVFSGKRLFGYISMVWALAAITFLSFIVWLHHFFTMGAGPAVNAFFGIMTMLIAIPTGVKIFNWLFTLARGRIRFKTPMLWFLAFVSIFTTGGMTGVLMSIAAADFQFHNSLFLIAHFHSMAIGGVLFGFFSGFSYWFPKITGYMLNEKLGVYAFWFWTIGFYVAFMPLYVLGLMGATRRLDHYDASMGWQSLFIVACLGAFLIAVGIAFQTIQLYVSIRDQKMNPDTIGDPWNGRTLEWGTTSPPPSYNFAVIPEVHDRDPVWLEKQSGVKQVKPIHYEPIHMPKNTAAGLYIGSFSFLLGFGFVWHIYWMILLGLVGMIASMIVRLADNDTEYYIPSDEIAQIEKNRGGN